MITETCRRKYKIIALFIPIFILFLSFIPMKTTLVFQFENSDHILAYLPISTGDIFQLKYTHSIHLSDVIDSYIVTSDHQIKQTAMTYEDFSIGMPENAQNGEIFEHKNGKYYLSNMNRIFPYFDLRTGKVRANHMLIVANKEYPISSFIEPGTWIRITIKKLNIWQQWKGVNILER
nr:DUF1850 domain-containing protein [uncultured Bacillus sp.]